jgi:hypothetical protein
MSHPSMFGPDPAFLFAVSEMWRIRNASRAILELALRQMLV